uniref:Uncharacterized protein n=1 Tax=Sphaerodactylus townsendi TaxID=933632 RepID=A0ACB8G7W3_9SAUR
MHPFTFSAWHLWTFSTLSGQLSQWQTPATHNKYSCFYEAGRGGGELPPRYTGRVAFTFSPTQDATIMLNDTRAQTAAITSAADKSGPDTTTSNIGVIQLIVFCTTI